MTLYATLENQLKNEPNYVKDNGELKKRMVLDKAHKLDEELIALLLANPVLKAKFFKGEKIPTFDKDEFVGFMEQKNYLNDSYTRYKNKIGLTLGGKYLKQRNEVALDWPYKDCILEGGQSREEDKKEEIFFNELLAQDEITKLLDPKVFTNAKRVSTNGELTFKGFTRDAELNRKRNLSANTITDNLIIKGNNLLALHSLKKEFAGKVKLIYIDPPYNTGGDANIFTYNNTFNHSTWLTFMKNRLTVAKQFLREDGFIAIAIDHCELFYLGMLADEIFGRENRLGIIAVRHFPGGRTNDKFFATTNEFMLVYAKNIFSANIKQLKIGEKLLRKKFNQKDEKGRYKLMQFARMGEGLSTPEVRPNLFYPIYYHKKLEKVSLVKKKEFIEIIPVDGTGTKRVWRNSKETFVKLLNDNQIVIKQSKGKFAVYKKTREKEGIKPQTIWYDGKYSASTYGTKLLKKYFDGKVVLFKFKHLWHTDPAGVPCKSNISDTG